MDVSYPFYRSCVYFVHLARKNTRENQLLELFKNVFFFLLIFSIEELKFAFTGTKISGKRNYWRVRTTVRTRLTKVVNASDCSDSGLSFLPVSASTLLFSNIWQLFGNLSKRPRTMVHGKFRAKGIPDGLSFVSHPYKRCSLNIHRHGSAPPVTFRYSQHLKMWNNKKRA